MLGHVEMTHACFPMCSYLFWSQHVMPIPWHHALLGSERTHFFCETGSVRSDVILSLLSLERLPLGSP